MKNRVKKILQKLLGLHTYLSVFAIFVIIKLRWDKNEKDFLQFLKMVPNKGLILDIGANLGVMTFYFCKKRNKAQVYSFEPVPFNFKVLKRIISIFRLKNCTFYNLALGEKNETIEMFIPQKNNVTMHGLCHVDGIQEKSQTGEKIVSKMIMIDQFNDIADSGSTVTAMKLDVENYEYNVLVGAKKTITKDKPLIYTELWRNKNRTDCITFLENLGYTTYIFNDHKLILYHEKITEGQNFVFTPRK